MAKKKSARVSVREVARVAGVSKSTAAYALSNNPEINRVTRDRILHIARKIGYTPDARIADWMARVREARTKDLVPIAWINTNTDRDAWRKYRFLSPYLEGAAERAGELGYRIEEFWALQPGMSMRRISQILYQRGIEGVIVTQFLRHYRLNWEYFAGVSLEGGLLAPRLHRVLSDHVFNLLLAWKSVKRLGYRRVGICIEEDVDRGTNHVLRGQATYLNLALPRKDQVTPLFYPWGGQKNERIGPPVVIDWIKRERPEVIIGHSNLLIEWARKAARRVPEDLGVVHLANDDDVRDWTGVCSQRHTIGIAAAELVITLIRNRQFGIPQVARTTSVRGIWSRGNTLITPDKG